MPRYQEPQITSRKLLDADPAHPETLTLGGAPSWYRYADGYKSAADLLVSRLSQRGIVAEGVCLPILFIYRHYVELSLKAILLDLNELIDAIPGVQFERHPLLPLWNRLRQRLDVYTGKNGTDWLDRAHGLISELEGLDPTSFTFRYPVDKQGQVVLAEVSVNMHHVRDVMRELEMIFDGIAGYLGEHVQISRELEREWRSEASYSY